MPATWNPETTRLYPLGDIDTYTEYLFAGCGKAPGRRNLGLYVQSRMLSIDRKNHEATGMRVAPSADQADAFRQRLNRAVLADWSDDMVRRRVWSVAYQILPQASAWIIDGTSQPKKGTKSAGVARQYCGELGKIANCQVMVSTHLSTTTQSLPLTMDLYLTKAWARDRERRREAGVPEEVKYRPKYQIALDQIDALMAAGHPKKRVVADSEFGDVKTFRKALHDRDLEYVVGVHSNTAVEPTRPLPGSQTMPGRQTIREIADQIPRRAFRTVRWREASKGELASQFVAIRVQAAPCEQWLLIEWPADEDEPTDFWLSNMSPRTSLKRLVRYAHLRWCVERDYQDLKQEFGLGDYQGRKWRGFQHHLTLCIAAMIYLALHRRVFPPEQSALAGLDSTQT